MAGVEDDRLAVLAGRPPQAVRAAARRDRDALLTSVHTADIGRETANLKSRRPMSFARAMVPRDITDATTALQPFQALIGT
jgi:hypothetical protein